MTSYNEKFIIDSNGEQVGVVLNIRESGRPAAQLPHFAEKLRHHRVTAVEITRNNTPSGTVPDDVVGDQFRHSLHIARVCCPVRLLVQ